MLSEYILDNDSAQLVVQEFGYIGVVIVSFIAGLNLLVPIPAATFVPIFTAGGIALPMVIFLLILGTMAANVVAYAIGKLGNHFTATHYPAMQSRIETIYTRHRKWLPYFVFIYAGLIPLPNETYLIPLGLLGVRMREFFIPLLLGTTVYQTVYAIGINNLFTLLYTL